MRTSVESKPVVNTHIATHGGESVECNADNMETVCDGLILRHGPGVPKVEPKPSRVGEADRAVGIHVSDRLPTPLSPVPDLENGFEIEPELVSVGTDHNHASAKRSQMRHEQKPYAVDVAKKIFDTVMAEKRSDSRPIAMSKTRMRNTGVIATANGDIILNSRAFKGLVGRFPCTSGAAYLADCPPELRAKNYNHWAVAVGEVKEYKDPEVVFRLRGEGPLRRAFAVVSPGYTAFDVHEIASALQDAFPSDARGGADYNGERLRFEGLWHADVDVQLPNVGEVFKAGVIIRSDDTGAGSVRVQSVMWRARCRNLMIFDEALGVDIRLRHTGSRSKLVSQFKKAFNEALSSVNAFRVSWSKAATLRDRDFINQVQGTTSENLSTLTPEAVLPGIFNGILERELVPVRGRAKDIVPKLMHMHSQDEARDAYGVSRASVINAFTRHAHEVETDPFAADATRLRASMLLTGTRGRDPAPLPYIAFNGRV